MSARPPEEDAEPVRSRALGVVAPGRLDWLEADEPPLAAGGVDVETVCSGLSAGTELTFLRGTNPMLAARWDAELGLFAHDAPAEAYPVRRLGYMEVGRVRASRRAGIGPGDLVAMAYGHKDRHVATDAERVVPLPAGLDPLLGVYVAHMGPICANGLLHAAADAVGPDVRDLGDGVRGRRVLVTGAGVIGLLVGLLARHHGAAEVLVADPTPTRRAAADALGLEGVDAPEEPGALARAVTGRWRSGPADRGADVVLQCRGRVDALAEALRCLRPQGTVIDLAFYPGGAPELRLGEEFHHNGLGVRCAQIGRVPRGCADRWDRERLSRETIALLRAHGDAVRAHVITDVVPWSDAPALLHDVSERRRSVIQAVLWADGEPPDG